VSESPEYDVAISFFNQDEPLALSLSAQLRENLSVFIYSEQQKELVGKAASGLLKKQELLIHMDQRGRRFLAFCVGNLFFCPEVWALVGASFVPGGVRVSRHGLDATGCAFWMLVCEGYEASRRGQKLESGKK
jgi:hypothetical protein